MPVTNGVRALEEGRAFAVLDRWRVVKTTGSDAVTWLDDLVTNRVDDVGPNELRRTLFLDRTGRIRADVHVGTTLFPDGTPGGFLVFQDSAQPSRIEDLLTPYILSSDVELAEGPQLALALVPGDIAQVQFMAWPGPSDRMGHMLVEPQELDGTLATLRHGDGMIEATAEDVEVHRIRRGVPRFGVDFGADWLPSEVGFDGLVDTTKGCFLGQESVAKVRNLGHPPRLVMPFETPGRVYPMAQVIADGDPVGRVTSVAPLDDGDGTACIGWVRWEARDAQLAVDSGTPLALRVGS